MTNRIAFNQLFTALRTQLGIAVITLAIVGAFFMPSNAHAYVTDQSVVQLNDTTLLFQITYRFNFLNRESLVPILAARSGATDTTVPHLQYSITDQHGDAIDGAVSSSIVLSDAATRGNQYYLPEATPTHFTLLSIVQLPESMEADTAPTLHVRSLPLFFLGDETVSMTGLSETDLTAFSTTHTMQEKVGNNYSQTDGGK